MDKDKARRLLHDVHCILDNLGLGHFLIDGTLLGAVREGDFIEHDLDIDLGVFAEEWDLKTIADLGRECFNVGIAQHHRFGQLDKYFELALKRDDIKLDLFFYRRDGDKRIFHAFRNGGRNLPDDVITYEYPADLIENLCDINFQNEMYPAPREVVKVLECKYGPTWKTPDTKWDWKYGPHNVRK